MELLAPAGNIEILKTAVAAGANAVYIGGKNFSARNNAQNFTNEEICQAVEICHGSNVKLYLALNTLIYQKEIKRIMDFADFAQNVGVDAFIIQDIGVAQLLKNRGVPLHASTQMTIHSICGAEIAQEMGFKRVVLSRELTKSKIEEICKLGIEVEIFVQGALCMSVSGQCWFSAFMGKRSANRGICGSVCRLPFGSKCNKNKHNLSLKDLCLISHISQIQEIGVTSLKIEGRMKNSEYIKDTVTAYRLAIDKKSYLLKNVFRNVEFTDGYFTGIVKDMFGVRK